MRLVFAGTPEAAVPALEKLLGSRHEVVAVVTRPDAPAGRGRRLSPSPVAARARDAGLEVLRPAKVRDPEFLDRLRQIGPDCCPVVAYGALLPRVALDIPRHGWVNLHFSLLPAWRGAAPVNHAILHGDDITGATTFQIVQELDAGPVYGVVTEPIRPADTAGDLLARLAVSGAELLAATLDGIESGQLEPRPQPGEGVSVAPKLGPDDARVDWTAPAHAIDRLIRACTPAPGAWTMLGGTRLKLGPVRPAAPGTGAGTGAQPGTGARTGAQPGAGTGAQPGTGTGDRAAGPGNRVAGPDASAGCLRPGELRADHQRVQVGTGTTPVELDEVQPQGKRQMSAVDWARGLRLSGGERLG